MISHIEYIGSVLNDLECQEFQITGEQPIQSDGGNVSKDDLSGKYKNVQIIETSQRNLFSKLYVVH